MKTLAKKMIIKCMHYGLRLGCRWGQPHDLVAIHEDLKVKIERCKICSKTFRWHKAYKGRMNNVEYLKAHVRQFAQPDGATRRVYNKLYSPEKCTITL